MRKWLSPTSRHRPEYYCKSKRRKIQQKSDVVEMREEPLWPAPTFDVLNLIPSVNELNDKQWKVIGNISQENATINTIRYIGDTSDVFTSGKHRFRIATNIAPPFVIESTKLNNNTCLTGDFCLKVGLISDYLCYCCYCFPLNDSNYRIDCQIPMKVRFY